MPLQPHLTPLYLPHLCRVGPQPSVAGLSPLDLTQQMWRTELN